MSYKYFTRDEFVCKETGENEIEGVFVLSLDLLRTACGFPFVVISGYRSPQHSVEAAKDKPGTHADGIAADIKIAGGEQRRLLVAKALEHGFAGIGVAKSFIHLDIRTTTPVMWTY